MSKIGNFFRRLPFPVRIILLASVLLVLLSPRVRYWVVALVDYPLHYKEYKHFGIRIPNGYSVHGIDVSRYQSRVDWQRVRNMQVDDVRISFAFIKATEGSWLKDRQFHNNWSNARKHGIIRGAYHFFLPNISPKDQAKLFIRTVKLKSGDLPPVVDIEETNGLAKALVQKHTKLFLDLLEKAYGIKPIIYTNRSFYEDYFANLPDFKNYKIWIAHYHVTQLNMPSHVDWAFWQHSDKGNVNGINEPVDFNVFRGGLEDLKGMCLR